MTRRVSLARVAASAALIVLFSGRGAPGRLPQVVESQPPSGGVVELGPATYFIRFAGPVDHYRSSLVIVRGGQVVHRLHPRLDAAPELLFGTAPALDPGAYELRWAVTSLTDGEVAEGSVAFTARRGRE